MGDPFLNGGSFISGYDGNPSISFSKWIEKFKDILSLITTPLTEEQKLARLRFCLNGQARAVYDGINPAPLNLEAAILVLKGRYENGNTKIIARQALSICRQAPGEPVFDFSNRLNEAVRTALSGENEETVQKRLLEEFLDRLVPELQFQVKSHRPTEYSMAYEQAQHFELLLSARKPAINIAMPELAEKVDALVVGKNQPGVITCYSCRKQGHIARYCPENPRNYSGENGRQWSYNSRANYGFRNYDNSPRHNYNGGYRNNQRYSTKRREEDNSWNYHNRQSPRKDNYRNDNNYRNYGNHQNYRRNSNSRESSRSSEGRSSPRVGFHRRSSPSIRVVSPLLFAFIAIASVFCSAIAQNPMLCQSNVPTSHLKFPDDPFCPSWQPSESPIPLNLYVDKANTLEYKEPATVFKCVKSKMYRRLGIFGSKMKEKLAENTNVPISQRCPSQNCYEEESNNKENKNKIAEVKIADESGINGLRSKPSFLG
nr:unnamed protein product [Meloidogyne enterolobii]